MKATDFFEATQEDLEYEHISASSSVWDPPIDWEAAARKPSETTSQSGSLFGGQLDVLDPSIEKLLNRCRFEDVPALHTVDPHGPHLLQDRGA